MAVDFDGWQEGVGTITLGLDENSRYVATIGGVTMSLPRQVGKTFTVGSLLIAMCLEFPGLRVVWTSHHLRTTTNTFRSMQGMVRRKRIAPRLAHNGIRTANGEQEIRFANGSIVMFGARERGFGVGIDAIDVLVCDEAQRLSSRSLADMMPTTNQSRHPHGALVFFIGTPPRPTDDGGEFTARRRKALGGQMGNGIFVELSADSDGKLDDPKQWAMANASYPHRTPHESMLRLRENLTDDDDWRREALGIWDDMDKSAAVVMPNWPACATKAPPPPVAAIAVAVDRDRVWFSIGACSQGDVPHLGAVRRGRLDVSRSELVADVARIQREHSCAVVLDRKGPASSLEADLEHAGVRVTAASLDDYVGACADLFDAVSVGHVQHGDYPELNEAVERAGKRIVTERWAWSRRNGDVSMLEAVTLAMWGATSKANQPSASYAF